MNDMEELYQKIGETVYKGLKRWIDLYNTGGLTKGELDSIVRATFVDNRLFEKICAIYEDSIQS